MSNHPQIEESFRALVEESRRRLGEPPSQDRLLAYHRGELPKEQAEEVREHLARDPETLHRFLDLTAHVPDPGSPDHLSDEDLARDWKILRSRLGLDTAEEGRPAKVVPFPSPRRRRVERFVALAAGIVLAVGAAQLWRVDRERDEMARRLSEPQVNQPTYALLPDGSRGIGEKPNRLSSGKSGVHLSLTLFDLRELDSYRLEIHDARAPEGSDPLWATDEVLPTADETFEITLPPGFLPPGEYLFQIYGMANGQREELAGYSVRF